MTTFTIDAENNITTDRNATDASECNPVLAQFDSQAALARLSADWPMSRFVEIWNSIPGNTEVRKLADRKKAVARMERNPANGGRRTRSQAQESSQGREAPEEG